MDVGVPGDSRYDSEDEKTEGFFSRIMMPNTQPCKILTFVRRIK